MDKDELIEKIIAKKEYSLLPKEDVLLAFTKFDSEKYTDFEKIKLTRDLLHKVFSSFSSQKLFNFKHQDYKWILKKHLSTRERLPYYFEVYKRIFSLINKKNLSVIDLGCGVNGFSYPFFKNLGLKVNYLGIEGVGQLVGLMNDYFLKEKINAKAFHESLFNTKNLTHLIKKQKEPRVLFLFKVIDSLETLKRNYSKEIISRTIPFFDFIVLSYATKSMVKRDKFRAKRFWIENFIHDYFRVLDDFSIGSEKFIIFKK